MVAQITAYPFIDLRSTHWPTLAILQDHPIEIDDEHKESASHLLDLGKGFLSPPSARAVSPVITSLPFLQVQSPSKPVTPKGVMSSPDFSTLRHQLTSLSNAANLSASGSAAPTPPINLATALSSLRSLASCEAEEAFGDKAGKLRDALVCLVGADAVPREARDAFQSFLQRLEGNCSALRTHKPIVAQYRTLRVSIDSYNANVMGLLDQIDKLEAEYNALVSAAKELQERLEVNVNRQTEIGCEQANLHTQSQQLIADYQANSKALVGCQNSYDFSLPIWNAAILGANEGPDQPAAKPSS